MDIPSFKGLMRHGKPTPADFTRFLHTVLTGLSRATFSGNEDSLSTFRESMLQLAAQVHEQASVSDLESTVRQAVDLLTTFNERAQKFNLTHTGELKAVMRTMTETITYLSESRSRSVHQLQFMERELEQATQVDDIRLLRARIMTCLELVKDETVRLQHESQARSTEVRQQIDRATKMVEPPPRFGAMDAITGLPGRRSAERALTEALLQGADHAIAVFTVKRLSAINAKYGRAAGDEVMLRVANQFAQHLSASTFLFRWSGPALVAVIAIDGNKEDIRKSWTRLTGLKQEINLEVKQRQVFVLVETVISFQVGNIETNPENLFQSLDQSVAEQADGTVEENLLVQ